MTTTQYFWDPVEDNTIQERDETGTLEAEYTTEPRYFGNVISQNRGGVEGQFHYDAQGSTLAVIDDSQNVTDTFAYTAFGEVTERAGTTDVSFQYIGQKGCYRDSMIGQNLARRAVFDVVRGRYLSLQALTPLALRLALYSRAVQTLPSLFSPLTGTLGCGTALCQLGRSASMASEEGGAAPPPKRPDPPKTLGKLPRCPRPLQLVATPGFDPQTNGCSVPPEFRFIFNKDAPIGGISFRKPCDDHDVCYATCGNTKEECDIDFYDALVRACEAAAVGDKSDLLQPCKEAAESYYGAVRDFGFGPDGWEGAQSEACECCQLCKPNAECFPPLFSVPIDSAGPS